MSEKESKRATETGREQAAAEEEEGRQERREHCWRRDTSAATLEFLVFVPHTPFAATTMSSKKKSVGSGSGKKVPAAKAADRARSLSPGEGSRSEAQAIANARLESELQALRDEQDRRKALEEKERARRDEEQAAELKKMQDERRAIAARRELEEERAALEADKKKEQDRAKEEEERREAAAKKKKRKSMRESSSDSSDSDSEGDRRRRKGKKKGKRAASSSSSSSSSESDSDTDKKPMSLRRIEDLFQAKATLPTMNRTRSAELRRLLLLLFAGTRLQEKEGKETGTKANSKAMRGLMKIVKAMVNSLFEYEVGGNSTGDPGARVHKLETAITEMARKVDRKMGSKAKEWLTVPGGPVHTPYGGGYKGKKKEAEETASASPKATTNAAAEQLAKVEKELERTNEALRTLAARPSYDPRQAAAANSLPTANAQFQPRPYQPVKCYSCGQPGHRAAECEAAAARQRNPPSATLAKVEVRGTKRHREEGGEEPEREQGQRVFTPSQAYKPQNMQRVFTPSEAYKPQGAESLEQQPGYIPDSETHTTLCGCVMCVDDVLRAVNSSRNELGGESRCDKGPTMGQPAVCGCGECGECRRGIDLMHKEKKEEKGTRQSSAREIEKQQQALEAQLASSDSNENTSMDQLLKEQARVWFEERATEAWQGEEEEEEEACMQMAEVGHRGPPRAKEPLREYMAGLKGKKKFDKHEEGRQCIFCKRKGHRRCSCMIVPPAEPENPERNPTELQLRKREFVMGLIRRARAPTVEELRKKGEEEARMPVVQRAIELGRAANEGNPWAGSEKRRDKLRKMLGYWWAIGADATVLGWIGFGVKLQVRGAAGENSVPQPQLLP